MKLLDLPTSFSIVANYKPSNSGYRCLN